MTALINLATFGPPWMAALPGLSIRHSLVMSQASTAASSVLPGGDAVGMGLSYAMLRRWGFTVEQVTVATAAFAVWNAFANVVFAVAAVGFLAVSGESHALLTTTAVIGTVGVAIAIVLFAIALADDGKARLLGGFAQRLWNRVARLLRRRPATGWDERLVDFRREAVGCSRRRWLALTGATLLGHITVFLVLLVALRAVGVSTDDVSLAEAFASWSLIRIITTIPITPGGLGVVELGLTGALVSFGGHRAGVVAAVLLYRVLTYVPPIAVGGVCLLVWRRLGEAVPPAAPPRCALRSEASAGGGRVALEQPVHETELAEHLGEVEVAPAFGDLAVLDPEDVAERQLDAPPRRRERAVRRLQRPRVGAVVDALHEDLVAGRDGVDDLALAVRELREPLLVIAAELRRATERVAGGHVEPDRVIGDDGQPAVEVARVERLVDRAGDRDVRMLHRTPSLRHVRICPGLAGQLRPQPVAQDDRLVTRRRPR